MLVPCAPAATWNASRQNVSLPAYRPDRQEFVASAKRRSVGRTVKTSERLLRYQVSVRVVLLGAYEPPDRRNVSDGDGSRRLTRKTDRRLKPKRSSKAVSARSSRTRFSLVSSRGMSTPSPTSCTTSFGSRTKGSSTGISSPTTGGSTGFRRTTKSGGS